MKRSEKEQVISEMSEAFRGAAGVFVADYKGLSVAEATRLRSDIRKVGGKFRVVKNTLLSRAVADTDYASLEQYFTGTTAVVTADDDLVATAKAVKAFMKEAQKLTLRGGAMGERPLTAADIETLADLPGLDELRGKLIGLLQAPMSRIVGVLNAPGGQVARVVKAYSEKQ